VQPVHHKLIQIFKAGTYTPNNGVPLTFDNQALEFIAATYNTGISKAPLVLGHPADNAPAFGEVCGLLAKKGKLYAHVAPNQALVDMVRRRHYSKVSASFYAPSNPGNPIPGRYFFGSPWLFRRAAPRHQRDGSLFIQRTRRVGFFGKQGEQLARSLPFDHQAISERLPKP
jgi:hypothetical protein